MPYKNREDKLRNGREHYRKNRALYISRAKKHSKNIRLINKQLVWDYLLVHPCVDCNESDPIVLDFDHVRGEKISNVATLLAHAHSKEKIFEEIAKCDVRCANCHRRKTSKELGWYLWVASDTNKN